MRGWLQVTWVKGWGSLAGPNEVKVQLSEGGGEATIQTKNILIATGSDSASVPGLEIDEQRCGAAPPCNFGVVITMKA